MMAVREINGPAGRLEALLDEPAPGRGVGTDGLVQIGHEEGIRAAVVLAHPHTQYGGTMHTKVIYQAAKALSRIGCAVLRFNFRGAGASAGQFTGGPGEMEDYRAALEFMTGLYPTAHVWAGGMSFGAWVALTVGAEDPTSFDLDWNRPATVELRLRTSQDEHEAEVLHPGRIRRAVFAQGDARLLRASGRAEGTGGDRRS